MAIPQSWRIWRRAMPRLLKPHPRTTLPVAMFRAHDARGACREWLRPEPDHDGRRLRRADPITMKLMQHADAAIIDFTGRPDSSAAGSKKIVTRSLVYTETAGCNSVVIDSSDNFDEMCRWIAHSLCQASAQMCTSVQNIYSSPETALNRTTGIRSFDEVCGSIVAAVDKFARQSKSCGRPVRDAGR